MIRYRTKPQAIRATIAASVALLLCAAAIVAYAGGAGELRLATGGAEGLHASAPSGDDAERPRSIILFIGDGMGIAHVTAAKIVRGTLHLERCTTAGFVMTDSADRLVTDSAAGGTALATGRKTRNGAVSVSPGNEPLMTVLEHAEEAGRSTGLVVTCSLTHATPAVFASHVENRNMNNEIARQLSSSGVDVLIGGGWAYFVPEETFDGKRTDGRDLLSVLRRRMPVALSIEELRSIGEAERFAAFLAPVHPPAAAERGISLAELAARAIESLARNERGFFLMVEGSQIDWAAHERDSAGVIDEMIDFDDAVGVGLDFAERDGGTLVIVTADHETGGFAIHDGSIGERSVAASGFTTDNHTAEMVPLLARGPGERALAGIRDNTEIGTVMIEYMRGR